MSPRDSYIQSHLYLRLVHNDCRLTFSLVACMFLVIHIVLPHPPSTPRHAMSVGARPAARFGSHTNVTQSGDPRIRGNGGGPGRAYGVRRGTHYSMLRAVSNPSISGRENGHKEKENPRLSFFFFFFFLISCVQCQSSEVYWICGDQVKGTQLSPYQPDWAGGRAQNSSRLPRHLSS